jgi:hypothetical protein
MQEPAIAGMRSREERSAGNYVVLKDSLDAGHVRHDSALKIAETPVAMTEHP